MGFFGREEGTRLKNLSPLRRMVPYLMVGRNESAVYFQQQIDVEPALAFVDKRNAEHTDDHRMTFFHVVLAAAVRVLAEREQLNRFVLNRKIYARKKISLSFAVKKKFADDGRLSTVKIDFEPTDRLEDVSRKVRDAVSVGKGSSKSASEKEMDLVLMIPGFLLKSALKVLAWLDGMNMVPAAMIREDPMYASMFLANLGSIGLDAPYHHLFEYGTIPLFVVIGKIKKAPVVTADDTLAVGKVAEVRYTFDERITDGYYAARSLEIFERLIAHPEELL
jgi:hypothetical protein